MSEQPARTRDRANEPSYVRQDQPAQVNTTLGQVRDRRLRKTLILANVVVWLIIIGAIKWLVF